MKFPRRQFLQLAAGAAMLPAGSRVAISQGAYPSHPIHLVVGFPPGSAADITARVFAGGASDILGQRVVIENKLGAGSSVAAEYVAHAPNDGYTLFIASISIVTDQVMHPNPAFDLVRDFAPITLLTSGPLVLVTNPQTNLHSVAELIALAKSKPGEVLCANVGVGSLPHFAAELFAQRAGIKLVHVPYVGSPQAVIDLLAGRVSLFFAPTSAVMGHLAAGKLEALATATDRRATALPDVPSMTEAGMPDFDASAWWGLVAPAGTPQSAIDRIAGVAEKAMHAPDAIETLKKQGFDPLGGGPDAFGHYMRGEITRWSKVARVAGVKS
jgi:tripartite-type tricarboxylate transporter receptor subunit TctC